MGLNYKTKKYLRVKRQQFFILNEYWKILVQKLSEVLIIINF